MHPDICPIQCFVPPFIMRNLIEKGDARTRAWLLDSLIVAERLRGRRDIISALPVATSARATIDQKHRSILNVKHGDEEDLPGDLVRDEGDPPSTDTAVNEAYDGLGATYEFYQQVFERNSIDNQGMRLVASVHFGADFNNALWNGRQMIFGDGDGVVFVGFTKSIDVIAHELTYGVTQSECALEYHDQPGALNESFSDVFGSLVKQYINHQSAADADWLIGEGILGPNVHGVAVRSMKAPGTAFDDPQVGKDPQPDHMRNFVTTTRDRGGVHINSGIPNHAFFLIATALGGNAWEDAGQTWYLALRRLTARADFQEAANVTFQSAGELFGTGSRQQQAVRDGWAQVGVRVAGGVAAGSVAAGRAAAPETDGAAYVKRLDRMADEIAELRKMIEALGSKGGKR
jgi:Zn-dependent metalloprotease